MRKKYFAHPSRDNNRNDNLIARERKKTDEVFTRRGKLFLYKRIIILICKGEKLHSDRFWTERGARKYRFFFLLAMHFFEFSLPTLGLRSG